MKREMLRIAALWVVCSASIVSAQDQNRKLNWAERMFSDLSIDFGSVARGADTRFPLILTNLYEENVTIVDVSTTCGCSAARPDKTLLKTYEKAVVDVQMDTRKFTQRKNSNVDVTLRFEGRQGSATRTVRVPITAYIRTDVVLTPGNADFGTIEYGRGGERTVNIAYAGRSDWQIREIQANNDHLHASLSEVSRGGGRVNYQLTVRLDENAPLGRLRDQIVLITNDSNAREVPVLVTGLVEPDIIVTPATFPLGRLAPGETKEFNVVIRGKRPFAIQNIECTSHPECFELLRPVEGEKSVHVLPLRLTAPDSPGEIEGEFTVTIAGRPQPVTFQAEGTIDAGS
jgi:hypothetical protein